MKYRILFKYVLLLLVLVISGNTNVPSAGTPNCGGTDPDIEKRVMSLSSQLELRYNDQVKEQIAFFIEKNKKLSATLLGRAVMYFPLIETTLAANQLPDELKYLPVLEAGLVPYLTSGAGASGLWQFMKPTAEQYGLKITNTIDERRDPEKSTAAASIYLKRLFEIYNDWTLVLAAYNCGDGVVNRALKKSNSRSYWDIQKYLPQQTQEFVPKFIAISYLMNYYYLHDIEPISMPEEYVYTASLRVFNKVDLESLAAEYMIDMEVIKRLNPSYIKGFIPETETGHLLTLPESKIYDFAMNTSAYEHIVAFSPASLQRQKTALANAETNQRKEAIYASLPLNGLPIPALGVKGNTEAIRLEDDANVKIVKLAKGISLADIAKENGMELASLMEFNRFDENNPPRIGDQVKLRM